VVRKAAILDHAPHGFRRHCQEPGHLIDGQQVAVSGRRLVGKGFWLMESPKRQWWDRRPGAMPVGVGSRFACRLSMLKDAAGPWSLRGPTVPRRIREQVSGRRLSGMQSPSRGSGLARFRSFRPSGSDQVLRNALIE